MCVCPITYTNIYIRLSPEVSLPTRCVFLSHSTASAQFCLSLFLLGYKIISRFQYKEDMRCLMAGVVHLHLAPAFPALGNPFVPHHQGDCY